MNKKHSVYLSGIVGAGKSDIVVFTDIAKASKMSVKIIKNFAKISALTFSLVFSLNSFGYPPYQPDLEYLDTRSAKMLMDESMRYYLRYMREFKRSIVDKWEVKTLSDRIQEYLIEFKNIFLDSKQASRRVDTIFPLLRMGEESELCVKRSTTDESQTYPANAVKAYCQAMNNFARQVFHLEEQRIQIVTDGCNTVPMYGVCSQLTTIANKILKESNAVLDAWNMLKMETLKLGLIEYKRSKGLP